MDLKSIKKSIVIVTGDKDVNELVTEYIQKDYDCFARAYLDGHPECRQCVIIAEWKDFETGEFRRDPLWVVCFEACKLLSKKQINNDTKEVEEMEMQVEKIEKVDELKVDELKVDEPEKVELTSIAKPLIEKPKRKSANLDGHSKTCYNFCSKCGGKKSTYESTYNNRLKRYGSVDAMNKNYLCKKCRKA
jgi:hypothetical protein